MKKREKKNYFPTPPISPASPISDGQLHGKAYWLRLQQEKNVKRGHVWYTETGNLQEAAKSTSRGGEWQGFSSEDT